MALREEQVLSRRLEGSRWRDEGSGMVAPRLACRRWSGSRESVDVVDCGPVRARLGGRVGLCEQAEEQRSNEQFGAVAALQDAPNSPASARFQTTASVTTMADA